ncbi:Imm52 family immunity protein [Streptomyces sp. NPDC059015]|uniref:Imm52 family immunity protein n=1 Tax=unclassified Streptomyces TaxID=2593676 RepID=UPI0036B40C82
MLNVVVNGFWGTRRETAGQVAERWADTLRALESVDGAVFGAWREATDDVTTAPPLPASAPALADYIERENREPDAEKIGFTTSVLTSNPGMPRVTVAIHAGGTSEYVTNSVAVTLRSRALDESVPVCRRTADVLRIIAESWDVDSGQAATRAQFTAVRTEFGLPNSAPRFGRSGYLSAGRAALAPEGLPGTYTPTAHDGLVIDLTRGGEEDPAVETILTANRVLRSAGALQELPVPYDRAKW